MTDQTLNIVYNEIKTLSKAQKDFLVSELIGDFLEETKTRYIFEYKHAPDKIVKVDKDFGSSNNKKETEISNFLLKISFDKNIKEAKKWFAYIDSSLFNHIILIQERGYNIRTYSEIPDRIPSFMKEIKKSDLECRKGYIVIRDYNNLDIDQITNWKGDMISKSEIIDLNNSSYNSVSSHNVNASALNRVLSKR